MRWLVVGGGTAGCVVAAGLSDDAANTVTLLEAGISDGRRVGGVDSLADLAVAEGVWPGTYVRGRGLGGTSRINGAIVSGDIPASLPVELVDVGEFGPVDRALLAAASDAEAVSLVRRDGRLLSAADVFLGPARGRANLTVVTETEVDRLLIDGGIAAGVVGADGSVLSADAVVVCAGTIGSAALLLRSGIDVQGLGEFDDHVARSIGFRRTEPAGPLVTGAVVRRGSHEVVALNHVGDENEGRGALLAGWLGIGRRGRATSTGAVEFDPLLADAAAALDASVALAVELIESRAFRAIAESYEVADDVGCYFHACGSCRAVVDDAGAVVDVARLYVCDASVLALAASGTFAPVVALAERFAARHVR